MIGVFTRSHDEDVLVVRVGGAPKEEQRERLPNRLEDPTDR